MLISALACVAECGYFHRHNSHKASSDLVTTEVILPGPELGEQHRFCLALSTLVIKTLSNGQISAVYWTKPGEMDVRHQRFTCKLLSWG